MWVRRALPRAEPGALPFQRIKIKGEPWVGLLAAGFSWLFFKYRLSHDGEGDSLFIH
jgi:hypothetical protein